jgi:4-hydroxybenzoate polyprenyltransferase
MGRELWMDIHDVEGDRASGIRTAPILFGAKTSGFISSVIQICASVLLLPMAWRIGTTTAFVLAGTTIALCVLLSVAWIALPDTNRRRVIYACWLPMIVGIGMLCV